MSDLGGAGIGFGKAEDWGVMWQEIVTFVGVFGFYKNVNLVTPTGIEPVLLD